MSTTPQKSTPYAAIAGCIGLSVVLGIAAASAILGVILTLAGFGLAVAIVAGRVPLGRHIALIAGGIGALSLLGTYLGITQRQLDARAAERGRVAAVARAGAAAAHVAAIRASAPELVARVRTNLGRARAAITAGSFDDAHGLAQTAKTELQAAASLVPPPDGAATLLAEADALFRDSANLGAINAALLDAREAKASTPAEGNVLAWAAHLETLATALRQAPAHAVARFGNELTTTATALDRQRARFRRQIERAQRVEEERVIRDVVCGNQAPPISPFDGELVGAESFVARSAHDPDSVDVEARYEFSVGRAGILGARLVRR